MNTAPKLSPRDKLKELLSSAYHHGRNSFHFNTGDQADKFLAALAPPSGEGVEPVAWRFKDYQPWLNGGFAWAFTADTSSIRPDHEPLYLAAHAPTASGDGMKFGGLSLRQRDVMDALCLLDSKGRGELGDDGFRAVLVLGRYVVASMYTTPQSAPVDAVYRAVTPEEEAAIDDAIGLAKITLRLPIELLGEIDHRAQQEGLIRVAWMRTKLAEACTEATLTTPPPASQERGGEWKAGDRVLWQSSNGTEFPGTIVRRNLVTYDCKLDDGRDAEDFVAARFKPLAASPPSSAAEHRLEMFTKSPGLHEDGCPLSGTPNLYASCDCGLGAAEQAKPDEVKYTECTRDCDCVGYCKAGLEKPMAEHAQAGEDDEYSQGICGDGAAILKNGVMLTIDEIVAELNGLRRLAGGVTVDVFMEETKECDTCGGMVACPKCEVTPAMIERAVNARGAYIVAMANKGKKRTTKGAMRAALVAALGAGRG